MVSPVGSGDLLLFLDVEINEGLKVVPRVSSTCSDTVESKLSIAATSQPPASGGCGGCGGRGCVFYVTVTLCVTG